MSWIPIALLAVPLAGAAALLLPIHGRHLLPRYGMAVSGLTLALAVALAAGFDHGAAARVQASVDLPWIPWLDLRFHLGVDGISLPLVVLTALLTFLCFGYLGWGRADGPGQLLGTVRPRALVFALLVLEVGMIGTFLALDLLLFFLFFEIVLIPMYFVIAIWGGRERRAAAVKFILYTLLGSAVLLLGLLVIWAQTGTLDMVALAAAHGAGMSRPVQILAFVAVAGGLAVKVPMWPLHTWLPDAHTEAPTVGSVLLAGVLLKMGTYGFARIAIPMLPEGAAAMAPWLGGFAVVGIVYGALACLAQRDLKRMIAYSSVGHMGFVLLGFATLTPVGINAALFGNIAHGLITGLLFFLAGSLKSRYGTADMAALGPGLLGRLPHLASLLTFAAVASFGMPGLAGFWGEMLALLGAFQPASGLSRPLYLLYMAIGGIGAFLTAAYLLRMLSKVTHGRPDIPSEPDLPAAVTPAAVTPEGPAAPDVLGAPGASDADGGADLGREPTPLGDVPEAGRDAPISVAAGAIGAGAAAETSVRTATGSRLPPWTAQRDAMPYELVAWIPLVLLILLFGLWPKALLLITTPAVQAIVQGVGL